MRYCMTVREIKSRIVANNNLLILQIGFIIINMDKLKRSLKHLIAPAIVLLLVAIMGVFSPIVSVAAALRVNPLEVETPEKNFTISNLPARTVKLGSEAATITVPTIGNSAKGVALCHAGEEKDVADEEGNYIDPFKDGKYTYPEVGQYEWRFYTDSTKNVLFDTYTVTVTDTSYSMTMPDNVVTVAPKVMDTLTLPLPSTYRVAGETVELDSVTVDENGTTVITLKDDDNQKTEYILRADIALENHSLNDKIKKLDRNGLAIDLSDNKNTGNLKVTYQLLNAESQKLLVALPLSDIELKNVTKDQVTFANIPTAPSVKNLSYYSKVTLTTPTADSAKVGSTSFNVEAQTSIYKVQCYLYSDEPKDWTSSSNIHNLTVEKNLETGKWVVKEGDTITDKYLEIDGLSVKVKALGWYRFQFETSTLFGYQLSDDFDADSVNIEQDSGKTCVRYWSDSVRIYRDSIEPDFAWVAAYNKDTIDTEDYDNKFSELTDYDVYLPMTEKPDATTSQKITINYNHGLVLPAIYPHDNATAFGDLKVNVYIDRIQDENGQAVTSNSTENSIWSNEKPTSDKQFVYDMTQPLQIKFVDGARTQGKNSVELSKLEGLYRVRITVEEKQPIFEGSNTYYSSGYANSKTKYLYFYVDHTYVCGDDDENSPTLDANNVFQVSDVYLWEGHTFDFRVPTASDNHTPAANIKMDYYLVNRSTNKVTELKDVEANASRITVDLDKLGIDVLNDTDFYIYAVARNFNAMQNNLKKEAGITNLDYVLDQQYFEEALFNTELNGLKDKDQIAQYGYAWKRAAFTVYPTKDTSAATATITVTPKDSGEDKNSYKAGEKVVFSTISADWGTDVDGQMTVAAYLVKDNGARVPVNVVNGNTSSAEIVSSVSFNSDKYEAKNWSFTPGVSGKYILVVTAKDHASSQIQTRVDTINIQNNGSHQGVLLGTSAATNYTIDTTISLGETITLPGLLITDDAGVKEYAPKNRKLYPYTTDGEINTTTAAGNYTITVLGVNDPNCMIGNKFMPNKTGTYVFQYRGELNDGTFLCTQNYVVQVNNDNSGTSSIRMGEDYDAEKLLKNAEAATDETTADKKHTVGNETDKTLYTYVLGSNGTGSENKPAYAITLKEFTASNYGAATDFVVDSASLYDYLEPIYENGAITGYMYPAIAIPMPNVITDTTSSDQVEITVQKSGSSTYLVSSKKMNAGGSSSKASVIDPVGGYDYYIFRPDGKFTKDCKDKYDRDNYLQAATSASGAAGVYTVSYKTNNTSVSFNVTFGNLENGSLTLNAGFLTYDNGKGPQEITDDGDTTTNVVVEKVNGHRYVTIDMSKVEFIGNEDMKALIELGPDPDHDNKGYNKNELAYEYYMNKVTVTVSYEGGAFIDYSDWSEDEDETQAIKIYGDKGEGYKYLYKFDLNQGSGTYKVNISMTNRYTGNTVSKSIEFTIDVNVTNKNTNLNTVWGIILVVLSVGLFAGVIFYFVKTARATRFVDVPNAVKAKKPAKTKTPKTEDKAPKAVEAPKEDVK